MMPEYRGNFPRICLPINTYNVT